LSFHFEQNGEIISAVNKPDLYDFRIDAWMPETLPMARLAEYLLCLSKVFANQEYVHFSKVRKGSAILESMVAIEAVTKVENRLKLVGSIDCPEDSKKLIKSINDMLRVDGASATLSKKGGAKILLFPGCKMPLAEEAIVHEAGELIGTVIKVGGKDATVPLLLQDTDGTTYPCTTTRELARQLAKHLFGDQVRVLGTGKWRRTQDRVWELDDFKLKSWEQLNQTQLADDVAALRSVEGSQWNLYDDPHAELKKLREA
jgi:hypothetical protein